MAFTVSDLIIETLKNAGVKRVYGIPGDSLNGFTDALLGDGTLSWQHVRHEEAAAFAAAGEAAVTGQLAACAASCGPGNLHLINGLYDAHRSRVPVVAIAAYIPSKEIGGFYFQETHPQELFQECSAYCELVSSPAQMPAILDIAIRTAIEQNDVAVLVIPGDILPSQMERPSLATIRPTNSLICPSDAELDAERTPAERSFPGDDPGRSRLRSSSSAGACLGRDIAGTHRACFAWQGIPLSTRIPLTSV